MRFTLGLALAAVFATAAAQWREPFVPIGVWYDAGDRTPAVVLRDLHTIRALGFNHIKTPVHWASAEPERGTYRFQALDRLLTLADQTDLKVIVEPGTAAPPAWLDRGSPDPRPARAFVEAVSSRAAGHRSVHAIEPTLNLFRVAMDPALAGGSAAPAGLAWRLDALRSAARERGWVVGELRAGPGATGADLRLWGWAALARGARAISYAHWYPSQPSGGGDGLVERDGATTGRARAAGELAGIVSRNAALFAPLRPRPSRVAVVYNPLWDAVSVASAAIAHRAMLDFYARMFARNVQTDILFPHEVAAGAASNYAVVYPAGPEMLPRTAGTALEAYVQAGGIVVRDARADAAGSHAIEPAVRVDGGGGLVEARFLESADALVLIGVNYDDGARAVTFTFAPDTPEAIWQNMETGASVSFVQAADGLTYTHAFAPRDALVLMIRKRLR